MTSNIQQAVIDINGVKITLNNTTEGSISKIIKELTTVAIKNQGNVRQKRQRVTTHKLVQREKQQSRHKSPELNNQQYELSGNAERIADDFNYDKCVKQPCIFFSFDRFQALSKDSLQVKARKAIIDFFVFNNNKPSTPSEINKALENDINSTYKGLSTYRNHCHRIGILAKDNSRGTFHLSKWFLSQVIEASNDN